MRIAKTVRLLWKLFPNSCYEIHRLAHIKGIETGQETERKAVHRRLKQYDLSDMGKPTLTLGYHTAMRAALNEIDV